MIKHTLMIKTTYSHILNRISKIHLAATIAVSLCTITAALPVHASHYLEQETLSGPMAELKDQILMLTDIPDETWCVYVKDLSTEEVICTGTTQLYAASLSKLYVMEYWANVVQNEPDLLDSEEFSDNGTIRTLITDMIEISDNNAFNELLIKIDENEDFEQSCRTINRYLRSHGYAQTGIYHTLHPADTEFLSLSEQPNYTTVGDCGKLMEKLYYGAQDADGLSMTLLELLEHQENTTKIPSAIPQGITVANKTGETEEVQHDIAIIYGPDTDYILAIMGEGFEDEGDGVETIRQISFETYYALNPSEVKPDSLEDLDSIYESYEEYENE